MARQPGGGESAAVGGMLAGLVGYGVALLFFFTGPGATPLAVGDGRGTAGGPGVAGGGDGRRRRGHGSWPAAALPC